MKAETAALMTSSKMQKTVSALPVTYYPEELSVEVMFESPWKLEDVNVQVMRWEAAMAQDPGNFVLFVV